MNTWFKLLIEVILFGLTRVTADRAFAADSARSFLRQHRKTPRTPKSSGVLLDREVGQQGEGFIGRRKTSNRNEGRVDLSVLLAVAIICIIVLAFGFGLSLRIPL